MKMPEIYTEHICSDCLQEIVNGELRKDIELSKQMNKTLAKWKVQNYIPAGLSDDMSPAFSWKPCPLCGDLAGERYEYYFIEDKKRIRTIDKIITKVNCTNGAPMGRGNKGERPVTITSGPHCRIFKCNQIKVFDCAVPLNYGGYDKGGAYWGLPSNLRVSYTKDLSYIYFYRQS